MSLPIQYQELETVYTNTLARGIQVLSITSAESGEGVTTLAEALARRSEAGGKKTLLVDFNLYHPAVSKKFDLCGALEDAKPDYLSICRAGNTEINIVTVPNEARYQMRLRERDIIEQNISHWRNVYDSIIIDTSPLNAINRGNIPAETVCALSDGVILMVLAGRTTEISVESAFMRIANAEAKLLGTVINDRFNPSLANELVRETYRLEKLLPKFMEKCRHFIRTSKILNPAV